jgi:hypothetical protein
VSDFEIAPGVGAGAAVRAYECKPGDPQARPLKVFTVDPSVTRADGAIATVDVPYEPLQPGPIGALFEVECADGDVRFAPLDLESPRILINSGLTPSVPNPAFHQQMVYAVASRAYATFRKALGRLIAWGQDEDGVEQGPALRLKLRPHVKSEGANAVYDKTRREIRFGYIPDPQLPNGRIFACLSHDIIVHEMTHALIDGLRSRFTIPTSADVLGFHEGLADLAAVFHHFLYEDVLAAQIRQVGPKVDQSPMLTRIAANFGLAAIGPAGVRVAVDEHVRYRRDLEAHEMGSVLVTAVFEAFVIMFRRKTERFLRLAGPQPPGFWSEDLVQLLAAKAAELARNFLDIGIRAIDYCPPLDVQLGEYLRAVITADASLVADDPWGYRETLIACFARRGIIPEGVSHLSEEALLWRPPSRPLPPIPQLSFADLRFNGDPSMPASAGELERQARALGAFVTQRQHCAEFGLMPVDVAAGVDPARVQSIRTARRVGPDGQVLFDLVAEVTQRRTVTDPQTGARVKFFGGSTILIGPHGEVRLVISKNIRRQERLDRQLAFQRDSSFWTMKDGRYLLSGEALPIAHAQGRACGLLPPSPLS